MCGSLNILLALPFFGIGMKTDLLQSCGCCGQLNKQKCCQVFQNWEHIECSTLITSSFRTGNSSAIIPSSSLAFCPKKRKCKKAKWLSEVALQIAKKRREAKSKGEKERYIHLNAEFQIIAKRDKKVFLSD